MNTFTDAELDALERRLIAHERPEYTRFQGSSITGIALSAIKYLRAQRREDALQYLSDEGQIADRIDAAVNAERERCIGIAHQFGKAALEARNEAPEKKAAALALAQGFAAFALVMGIEPK